jgi:membrane associated rhomboid family serine protease
MRLSDSWSKARVTLAITLVTAAAWLIVTVLRLDEWAMEWGAFVPASVGQGGLAALWTPLTATLIHANIVHLAFNLVILVFCGRPVESVLGPIGLAILYLVGAFAAAGAQYLAAPASEIVMVGASGAISAVLGAYAMLFGRNKVKVKSPRLALWLNALWLLAAWVVLNLIIGIVVAGGGFPLTGAGMEVAVAAHIGGFVAGVLLAYPLLLFRYRKA